MPRPRLGRTPMTSAERQARPHGSSPWAEGPRARLRQHGPTAAPAPRAPSRPQRWATAVAALLDLQDQYRAWLDNLPGSLEDSRLAGKLQAIAELDLEELQAIDPPLGNGRD
jgi:hypothetical protein